MESSVVDQAAGAGVEPDGSANGHGDVELGDLVVEGTAGQLSFSVGGRAPTTSGLKLVGGKVDIEGEFAKGEVIVLRVEAEVGEVAFIDQRDPKTRQVVGCERRHKARIVGVERE